MNQEKKLKSVTDMVLVSTQGVDSYIGNPITHLNIRLHARRI